MLENIRLSLNGIKTHKLRSFLTMLGVIIGIASIIAIVSIVTGTNQKLETNLIGSGNNVVEIALTQDGFDYDMSYSAIPSGVPMVADEAMQQIGEISGVESATRYHVRQGAGQIYYQDNGLGGAYLYGIDDAFLQTYKYTITRGRTFNENELNNFGKVALLDTSAAESLFESEDPLGKVIEIEKEPFVVVGVYQDPTASEVKYETIEDYYRFGYTAGIGQVCIPSSAWPLLYRFDEPQNVAIRTSETGQMSKAGSDTAEVLNAYVSNESVQYRSKDTQETAKELETLTDSIHMMLLAIASLSLLVGGIGVMNIMLVSVTERTSEIGLKKALGAKRRVILGQFLTESSVLTLMGGILGVIVGIGAAWVIAYVYQLEFAVSIPWMLIAVGFSVFIGIIFGAMPAYRAAKLDPIEALRRE